MDYEMKEGHDEIDNLYQRSVDTEVCSGIKLGIICY